MTRPRRRTVGRRLPPFRMTDHDEMTGCSAWDDWAHRETVRQALVEQLPSILDQALCVHGGEPGGGPPGSAGAAGAAAALPLLHRAAVERSTLQRRWFR